MNFNGTVNTVTGTGSWDLVDIPRATKPVLNPVSVMMGSTINITLPRAVDTYTHDLYHDFQTGEWTLFEEDADTSASLFVPASWSERIPDAASAVGKIRCVTYNGSNIIGEVVVSFTAQIPDGSEPTISAIAVSESDAEIRNQFTNYIQGHSKLRVKISAAGKDGSTIKSGKVIVANNSYDGLDITTEEIQQSGQVKVTAIVTDSRGRTAAQDTTVTVLPYANPEVISFKAYRANSQGEDSNEGITLKVEYSFSITNCSNENTKNFKIEYRKSEEDIWTTMTSGSVYTANTSAMKTDVLANEDVYVIRLTLTDFFHSSADPVQYETKVEATIYPLAFLQNLKGVGIGGLPTKEAFQVFMQSEFFKTVRILNVDDNGTDLDVGEELLNLREFILVKQFKSVAGVTVNANTGISTAVTLNIESAIPDGYKCIGAWMEATSSNGLYCYYCAVNDAGTDVLYQLRNVTSSAITAKPNFRLILIRDI